MHLLLGKRIQYNAKNSDTLELHINPIVVLLLV